ncbi:MAG: amidohydrolase [Treponemataceae bacterium]
MTKKEKILSFIETKRDVLTSVNDRIWEYAETRFEESKSSELISKVLADEGFAVTKGVADMDTAIVARFGSGKPVIGFLGEYDALYGLSQSAGTAEKKPLVEGGKGHGCGHQALGATALTAAIATKDYLKENKIKGTVVYFGCPGEEGGSGKVYMVRAGCFKDVDVALTSHPGTENYVTAYNMLATITTYFKFHGTSSHAGATPHLGRSALDAVELMNVGANYLREHIIPEARLHYAITDSGGLSPNVVQSKAAVLYQIRAPKLSQAKSVYERVINIAKGAALMTETRLEIVYDRASSEIIHCRALEKLTHEKLMEAGPVSADAKDIQFAKEIRKTLTQEELSNTGRMLSLLYGAEGEKIAKSIKGKDIVDTIYPFMPTDKILSGSTDMGDVSWVVPTVQLTTSTFANDTPFHSWQAVAQGKTELCHKGMLKAGEVLALVALDLLEKPELLADIKKDFAETLGGETYGCPIPPDVKPSPKR